jgi:hypothetical protein
MDFVNRSFPAKAFACFGPGNVITWFNERAIGRIIITTILLAAQLLIHKLINLATLNWWQFLDFRNDFGSAHTWRLT